MPMTINVDIDNSELVLRLHRGQRRLSYGVVNAINKTAKKIQVAERAHLLATFNVRQWNFMRRQVAIIQPFASVTGGRSGVSRAYAEIRIGHKKRLLLSKFERDEAVYYRTPFTAGAKATAEPVVGGPARPEFADPVPPAFRMKKLNFRLTKRGKRRVGITRTQTYLVPGVGVFQRTAAGPEGTRIVYYFDKNRKRIPKTLEFYETAIVTADEWFGEFMEREVINAIGRAGGRRP